MIELHYTVNLSIHQASEIGDLETIKTYAQKGIDPFILDENGFSPLYLAQNQAQKNIVKWFDRNYPSKFPILSIKDQFENISSMQLEDKKNFKNFLSLDDFINTRLRWCGLRKFSMDLKASENIISFISNMFENFTKPINEQEYMIDEITLSYVVFGIIEEITPFDFLNLLLEKEPTLNYQQMSLCFYLIKELIKQDTDNEYILHPDFEKSLNEILEKSIRNPAFKQLEIPNIFNNFYKSKCNFTLHSFYDKIDFPSTLKLNLSHFDFSNIKKRRILIKSLVQDLSTMMADQILNLTPFQFLDVQIKNTDVALKNNPWINLLNTTNTISHMVSMDILKTKNAAQREQIYKFYIKCISYCLLPKISNIAVAYAIYTGLQSPALDRLQIGIMPFKYGYLNTPGSITKECLSLPNCIPPIACYSSFKEQVNENLFSDKLLLKGKINFSFFQNRLYALSCTNVVMSPLKASHTNVKEKLEQTSKEYSDLIAYYLSYVVKPPIVIELTNMLSLEALEGKLNLIKNINAPLVVCKNKNIIEKDKMASHIIINYAKKHFSDEFVDAENRLCSLCNDIITQFEACGPKNVFFEDDIIVPLKNLSISHTRADSLTIERTQNFYVPYSLTTKLTSHSVPSTSSASFLTSPRKSKNKVEESEEDIIIGKRKRKKN